MNTDPALLRLAANDLARESLHFFTRRMFKERKGFKWADNWHHRKICEALERVARGECKRLIINVPPRYSKTEIAVVNFIAWSLGKFPDSEFIHTSYATPLARNNSAMARSVVESEAYAEIFPNIELCDDSNAKGDWRTTEGGVVYATGAGGTITGFGAGKMRSGFGGAIIIDDPHKASEATSETMRGNVIDWFGNTLESRKNGPETPIIVIMQRLHEADLSGFLLAGGNGEEWEHLCLEAIQPDGTALWPAKHAIETLRVMEKANPYVFAGQYQQRPSPLAGGEFKPDQIEIVDAAPIGTRWVRAWDFAGTEAAGDWTVGGKLGIAPDGRFVIGHVNRFQQNPEVVERELLQTADIDGNAVGVVFPQDPGQAGKAQSRRFRVLLSRYATSSKPVTGDKVTRARPLAAQVNVGNVIMVRGDWNEDVKAEMRSFPNGKHDDIIDALSLGHDSLTDSNDGMLDYYKRMADEKKALQAAANKPQGEITAPEAVSPSAFMNATR